MAEGGEAKSFGGVEAELGHGEGGVEDAMGVVDTAAGDCHRHGSRPAARGEMENLQFRGGWE